MWNKVYHAKNCAVKLCIGFERTASNTILFAIKCGNFVLKFHA